MDPTITPAKQDSITVWFEQLRAGDEGAAAKLWDRFFDRLVAVARKQMANSNRRVADEEDIASGVMAALCRCADRGKLPSIESRDDLWRILLAWVRHDVIDHARAGKTLKRGGDQVRGDSVFHTAEQSSAGFDLIEDYRPTPSALLEMQEQFALLLQRLADTTLRKIAIMKMEGCTNQEIAQSIDVSPRTVERKIKLIREIWS